MARLAFAGAIVALAGGSAHAGTYLQPAACIAAQSALVLASGKQTWAELQPGQRYLERANGWVKVVEVDKERQRIRISLDDRAEPVTVLEPGLSRMEFALPGSEAAQALTRVRVEEGWHPKGVALLFGMDALTGIFNKNVALGKSTPSREMVRYYEQTLQASDRRLGITAPKDFLESLRDWRLLFSRGGPSPGSRELERLSAFFVQLREDRGLDLVREGVLRSFAERDGAWSQMGVESKKKDWKYSGTTARRLDFKGNSPPFVGRSIVAVPSDVRNFFASWLWTHGVDALHAENTFATLPDRPAIRHLGSYYPTGSPRHATDVLSQEVLALKNSRDPRLADRLADDLVAHLGPQFPAEVDEVVAVPSHSGDPDAAHLLAEAVAHRIGKPFDARLVARTADSRDSGRSQVDADGMMPRVRNAAGSYRIQGARVPLEGRRILIVDDIAITEATVEELRRIIAEAGGIPVVVTLGKTGR